MYQKEKLDKLSKQTDCELVEEWKKALLIIFSGVWQMELMVRIFEEVKVIDGSHL